MKKRLTALTLSLALCAALSPAWAAGVEDKFPAVNEYPGFADVPGDSWMSFYAQACYEMGLMNGTDNGFEPDTLLTNGEAATLVARVREKLTGEPIEIPDPGTATYPWTYPYTSYLESHIPSLPSNPQAMEVVSTPIYPASRSGFLSLLALAIEDSLADFPAINAITFLPDTQDPVVLNFYNIGILTGVDKYGTFTGDKPLTRIEAATMISRVARPSLRQTFVPQDYSPFLAASLSPSSVLFGTGVTAESFLTALNAQIAYWEGQLGDSFNWHADAGDGSTVLEHIKADVLASLGVTEALAGPEYQNFDYQVYYSRLIDLMGAPLSSNSESPAPTDGELS